MVIPCKSGDNAVEMPIKRCPPGSSERTLLIVACMDAGKGREQDAVALLDLYLVD